MNANTMYTLCTRCQHFVERNCDTTTPGLAKFVHLDDGEQEYDHDAVPGVRHTLRVWKKLRPDLFTKYRDGKVGPNSRHHTGKETR